MKKQKKDLIELVLKMDNNRFYSLTKYGKLVDGITVPLTGQLWKLIMYRDIKEYFQNNVRSTQGVLEKNV